MPSPEEIGAIRNNILAKENAGVFMTLMNNLTNLAAQPTSRFGWEIIGCKHCRIEVFRFFGVFSYSGPDETDENPVIVSLPKSVLVDYVSASIGHLLEKPACLVKTREEALRKRREDKHGG